VAAAEFGAIETKIVPAVSETIPVNASVRRSHRGRNGRV
jgi:hypothetical protein